MLDKLQLNNKITALKKEVQTAKLNTIQKLVRRIKNAGKTSDKVSKSKRPINTDSLKKEIEILKKLSFRDVVKNCLLLERHPKAVLSDVNEKLENRCIARLAEHKRLQQKLKIVKEMFMLDEEENKKALRSMGNRQKKLKNSKGKKKPQNHKMEWIEEPNDQNLVTGTIQEEGKMDSEIDKQEDVKPKKQENQKMSGKAKKSPKLPKTLPKRPAVEFSSESEDEENEAPVKTIDSFFLTSSGANYEATASKNNLNDNEDDEYPKRRYYDEKNDELAHLDQEYFEDSQNNFTRNPKHFKNDRSNEQNSFRKSYQFDQQNTDGKEDLHPSWKAKKQQKIIQPFQGKKITFNTDAPSKSIDKLMEVEDLHPSWAAKMKTKPIIAEFAGKKIKFDDD